MPREQNIGFIEQNQSKGRFQRRKKTGLGRREGRKRDIPALLLVQTITKSAYIAYGCGVFRQTLASNHQQNYSTIVSRVLTREIFGKTRIFCFPGEKRLPKSTITKYPCVCLKPTGSVYNRGICGEKDWAAVRREERRELPQPVVIVRNLYAGLFE
jgi:hypothetical protein